MTSLTIGSYLSQDFHFGTEAVTKAAQTICHGRVLTLLEVGPSGEAVPEVMMKVVDGLRGAAEAGLQQIS